MSDIKLTAAQALTRYLRAQKIGGDDGGAISLFAGVFAIFGHGNVTCLSEALYESRDELPVWRGQNEQSMALAALGYTKAMRRRRIMAVSSSIGPGATNFVTASACAHINRLPILILAGDTFNSRLPDPVLQQAEHFDNPTTTVNDAHRAVARYWDRITHPAQIMPSLPQAIAMMLDPAACGPAFIGLPQDVQAQAFDYPEEFFAEKIWRIPRPRADKEQIATAAAAIQNAKRPLFIAGGGVLYSGAEDDLLAFCEQRGVPICETVAGRGCLRHDAPQNAGPIGVIGSASANALAEAADVIIAVGTRLQDFTTGSWSAFARDCQIVAVNAARFDAHKHRAYPVIGDAKESIAALSDALGKWRADKKWSNEAAMQYQKWNQTIALRGEANEKTPPTYAQVIAAINRNCKERDRVVAAAGGIPGEINKMWQVRAPGTFDCEFGYSCMGYEIAGGWGAAMANRGGDTVVMCGDGSYMMMNSDIYSAALTGHKIIVVVCDNGGYAVIDRLQNYKGTPSFNNMFDSCRVQKPFAVDFAAHAKSMGAASYRAKNIAELEAAFLQAKAAPQTAVIVIETARQDWTPGDAWWDVGVPEVSESEAVRAAKADHESARAKQRRGI